VPSCALWVIGASAGLWCINTALSAQAPRAAAAGQDPLIVGARIDTTIRYNDIPGVTVLGDTFMPAWADDGNLYLTSCDTSGWDVKSLLPGHNFELGVFKGDPTNTTSVHVHVVNPMKAFGEAMQRGTDNRTWKAAGLASVDGVLYLTINRHRREGDPSPGWADNASILKSSDHGRNWTNHLGQLNRPPSLDVSGSMFPGTAFPFLEFVVYGQDGRAPAVDRAREFVYAYSTDSITNAAHLLRVRRTDLPSLRADKWEYYKSGDGNDDANWSSSAADAVPILAKGAGISGEIVYDQPLQRYVMAQWGRGLRLFEAPHPWGGWTLIKNWPEIDARFSSIPNKFISADGKTLWLFYSSDYHKMYKYTLWMAQITLVVKEATPKSLGGRTP